MEFLSFLTPFAETHFSTIWGGVGVLVRISLFLFLLPGIGETTIPVNIRLLVAFWVTFLLGPLVLSGVRLEETSISALSIFLATEAFYGFVLGFAVRILIFSLQIAGTIIAQSMSLSQIFGGGVTLEPNTTVSTLLILSGTTLAVTMGLHVQAIALMQESYAIFPIGSLPATASIAQWATQEAGHAFAIALSLALPFVLLNFIYNLVLGALNKAMPQLMVSFVGMPLITGVGLVLLAICVAGILTVWLEGFDRVFITLPGE